MLEQATGSYATRAGWVAALLVVPAALAGVSLLWPGPQLGDDLGRRSHEALVAIDLAEVGVTVEGRDAVLAGVPAGSERVADHVVGAVTGIRRVTVATAPAGPTPTPTPTRAPAAPLPAAPSGTPAGSIADRLGALAAAAPVTFAADRAELVGPAAETVRRAGELLATADTRVDVEGHVADTPGSVEVAQRLSDQRAQVVADALVATGVDRARITTRGLGAQRPLATPAASRRVEIVIP